MGRPKVLPANRLRANTACTTCRASKKRCSGSFPCTNCINKGRGHTCIPFKSISATDSRSRRESTLSRQPLESIPTAWTEINADFQSPRSSQIQDASPSDRLIGRPLEAGSRSPEATHRTHPRMLRNLQGERGMHKPQIEPTIANLTGSLSLCWQGGLAVLSSTASRNGDSAYRAFAVLTQLQERRYARDGGSP